MSIVMTLYMKGDPRKLEQYAADHRDEMGSVVDKARAAGLIAHRFYGSEDGEILVADEWPDKESFEGFFASERERIEPMMAAAGITTPPEPTYWRSLESHDHVGWGA
jgi:heme-degrading monooxygenase HmoA